MSEQDEWTQGELWPVQPHNVARPNLRLLEPQMPLEAEEIQLDEAVLRSWSRYEHAWRPILVGLCRGLSNKAIAKDTGLPVNRVRNIVGRLFDCSGADTRLELAHLAQYGRRNPDQSLRAVP